MRARSPPQKLSVGNVYSPYWHRGPTRGEILPLLTGGGMAHAEIGTALDIPQSRMTMAYSEIKNVNRMPRRSHRAVPGQPLTGPYYWIPLPKGKSFCWTLIKFYDQDHKDGFVSHTQIWAGVLAYLTIKWQKPPKDSKPIGELPLWTPKKEGNSVHRPYLRRLSERTHPSQNGGQS
jgi:hypothetical protein